MPVFCGPTKFEESFIILFMLGYGVAVAVWGLITWGVADTSCIEMGRWAGHTYPEFTLVFGIFTLAFFGAMFCILCFYTASSQATNLLDAVYCVLGVALAFSFVWSYILMGVSFFMSVVPYCPKGSAWMVFGGWLFGSWCAASALAACLGCGWLFSRFF